MSRHEITDAAQRARRITRTSYVGIGANLLLAAFKAAVGLVSGSVAIVLDAVNNLTDALSSVLTIVGVKAEMLFGSIDSIMERRPDVDVTKPIRETAEAIPGVLGVHDLILHNYGPDFAIGSLHVEVDGGLGAVELYRITRSVQAAVYEKFRVILTVGIYAVDPSRRAERELIERAALAHPGVLGVHGVFFDDKARVVAFDILSDFTVRDRAALRDALLGELAPKFPGRSLSISFDSDYAD